MKGVVQDGGEKREIKGEHSTWPRRKTSKEKGGGGKIRRRKEETGFLQGTRSKARKRLGHSKQL